MQVRERMGWYGAAAVGLALGLTIVSPQAQAAGMKECSLKYQTAKKAGTLNGEDWKAFRAAQCGSASSAGTTSTAAAPAAAPVAAPAAAAPATTAAATPAVAAPPATTRAASRAAAAPAATGNAVFPSAVNSKYASLKPGKARLQTCLDQYHANKSSGGNGGLKWIEKGGGFYSQCTKRLKGA